MSHSSLFPNCVFHCPYHWASDPWTLAGQKYAALCWVPTNSTVSSQPAAVSTSGVHSSAFSCSTAEWFFFFLVIAHPWTESFPEDLKQIPILVSQILFATSSMLTLKLDPLSTLVRSFVDGTVPTWDHQLWPAKHHHVLTLTLLRAINDGATIAFSNSRHYVRLKRKLIYKYHETYVTATFHKNYTKWNKYHTDYFFK